MNSELLTAPLPAKPEPGIAFEHRQSAHCETGVISNLVHFHGLEVSEPMAFGIGSGLFFSYFPFIKVNGIPVASYRILPGDIFRKFTKRTGIEMERHSFRSPEKAMRKLDEVLEQGLPVGMLTSVFYLPYLPKAFRFHFNAHNIVVYGKVGNEYLVSDPVMENVTTIAKNALVRARFAKGTPNTNGRMYYPTRLPEKVDLRTAAIKGINETAKDMATIPVPLFGGKAINYLAGHIRKWPSKQGERRSKLYLGQVVRMQEEIGTGGGGFRFMYAAFLREYADTFSVPELVPLAAEMTEIGDLWRSFAYEAGRTVKGRDGHNGSFDHLADIVDNCGHRERAFFAKLRDVKL